MKEWNLYSWIHKQVCVCVHALKHMWRSGLTQSLHLLLKAAYSRLVHLGASGILQSLPLVSPFKPWNYRTCCCTQFHLESGDLNSSLLPCVVSILPTEFLQPIFFSFCLFFFFKVRHIMSYDILSGIKAFEFLSALSDIKIP